MRRAERAGQLPPARRAQSGERRGRRCACGAAGAGWSLGGAVFDSSDGDPRGDAADREGDVVLVSQEPAPRFRRRWGQRPEHRAGLAVGSRHGNHKAGRSAVVARSRDDGQLKPANIWCAGQTFTADGRLVVFGGNLRFSRVPSISRVSTRSTRSTPGMRPGQSSPTCATDAGIRPACRMSDGRIAVINGLDESGAGFKRNPDVELFTPSADMNGRGTVSLLGTLGGTGEPPSEVSTRTCSPCPLAARWWPDRSPRTPGFSTRRALEHLQLAGLPERADRTGSGALRC